MTKKNLISLLIILVIGVFICLTFLPRNPSSQKEVVFTVEKGEGSRDIALNLEKQGLIRWAPVFRLYVFSAGVAGNLQAGNYFLSPAMNIPEIAEKFAKGDTAEINITIPEGFTSEEIYQKLTDSAQVNLTDLKNNEGYLFPDTYEISYGAATEEIIKIMTDNFDKKTADLETTHEIVVMASILEKEVKTKEEKELAAGVLWKRLKIGMPLQVDAAPETYEVRGLPAKPICNPGLESITVAIYPKSSDYWYYLSTPEGKTIFSKTLEEHNIAKAKYLNH